MKLLQLQLYTFCNVCLYNPAALSKYIYIHHNMHFMLYTQAMIQINRHESILASDLSKRIYLQYSKIKMKMAYLFVHYSTMQLAMHKKLFYYILILCCYLISNKKYLHSHSFVKITATIKEQIQNPQPFKNIFFLYT